MHKLLAGASPAARSNPTPKIQALRGARLFCLALFVVCAAGAWVWLKAPPRAPARSPTWQEPGGGAQAGARASAPAGLPAPIQGEAPGLGATTALTRTFMLQSGTPAAIRNFLQPASGCAWAGIGGQVFDLAGQPVSGMMVKVSGVYQGQALSKVAVTNSSQGFGPGGYDIYLGSQPQAATLTLQLVDVTGAPRSDAYRLTTYSDCQRNLLVINLRERLVLGRWYLPLAGRRR